MAIARTNSAKIGATTAVTGISGAFDCTAGDFLIAFAQRDNTNVQTCTFNGTSMTLAVSTTAAGSSGRFIDVFYLKSPASGSNTLASSGTGLTYRSLIVASYSGTNTTTQPDSGGSSAPAIVAGTSKTTALTPSQANCWIVGLYLDDNGGTVTANNSAVIIGSTFADPGSVDMIFDTNGTVAASAITVGGQSTVSGNQGIAAFVIAPATASTITGSNLLLMCVG